MIICFFSDIHGNMTAFQSFLKDISKQKIDLLVFGGDAFGYYYDGDSILGILREAVEGHSAHFPAPVKCLLGNHDKNVLDVLSGARNEEDLICKYGHSYEGLRRKVSIENQSFLKSLPLSYQLQMDGLRIGFFHGGPDDPLNMRIYPDAAIDERASFIHEYDCLFCGHTHHKMHLDFSSCSIFNPGSIGQQRDGKGCSYLMFDTLSKSVNWKVINYDVHQQIKEVEKNEKDKAMRLKLTEVLMRKKI